MLIQEHLETVAQSMKSVHIDPNCEPAKIEIDAEKVTKWIANGAQPTETVARLFKVAGISK